MAIAVIKFRDREQAVQYSNVERVMPFGSQAMAIEEGGSTLIVPIARVTEVILLQEEEDGGQEETGIIVE